MISLKKVFIDFLGQIMHNTNMMKRKARSDRNHALYMLTNCVTGERYIGITVVKNGVQKSLKVRWQKHVRRALTENKGWALCESICKSGADNFVIELLGKVRGRSLAHSIERDLIAMHKPELNQY